MNAVNDMIKLLKKCFFIDSGNCRGTVVSTKLPDKPVTHTGSTEFFRRNKY